MTARFPRHVTDVAGHDLVIGVRAGRSEHKFTAVWSVVVDGRIYARSWRLSPEGWNADLRQDTHATIQVGGAELPATAVRIRNESVNAAVDAAYRAKYHTPASSQYVDDLTSGASRESTVEFARVSREHAENSAASDKHAPQTT